MRPGLSNEPAAVLSASIRLSNEIFVFEFAIAR